MYEAFFHASTLEHGYCTLKFALTEDEEGNVKWRIFSGTLPRATATPELEIHQWEDIQWGICVGAGFSSALGVPLNNNLTYDFSNVNPSGGTESAGQTLTAFAHASPYPSFILLADYFTKFQYADTDNVNYDNFRATIVLVSGGDESEKSLQKE
ncbi:hypothetical protein SDC9_158035 [bioreactor metagenome]|uniref:Uncharacterized protein n=1 Tax=bioreactor metagenome TaxID=1076179 RepID=A0A645F8R3_9ZZZZ